MTFSLTQTLTLSLPGYDFIINFVERQKNYSKGFMHQHPYMEIYYVLSGEATTYIGDEVIPLKEGNILILSKEVRHLMEKVVGDELDYFVLIFRIKLKKRQPAVSDHTGATHSNKDIIEQFVEKLNHKKYLYFSVGKEADILFSRIYDEIQNRSFDWETVLKFYYYQFFNYVVRSVMPKAHAEEICDFSNIAIRATEYLHERYSEKITLESLGNHLHVSPRHANRTFKKMYGCTFYETLKQIRLVYAKQLLFTTNLPIEIVAFRTGFSSAQSLSQAYKKQEGETIRHSRKTQVNS